MSSSGTMKKCFCGVRASSGRSSTESNLGHHFLGYCNWKSNDYGFFEWMDFLSEVEESSSEVNQSGYGDSQRVMNDRQTSETRMDQTDAMRRKIVELKDMNKEIHIQIL